MEEFINLYWWHLIWGCLILIGISSFGMANASRYFIYQRWTIRTFSIMDLEFPSSARYYSYITISLNNMKDAKEDRPINALKSSLYWDFVFMFGVYPFIALLAFHVASLDIKFPLLFVALAWLQILAWVCDIVEDVIIFMSINKPKYFIKNSIKEKKVPGKERVKIELHDKEQEATSMFTVYKKIVELKWIIALLGLIASLIVILYKLFFTNHYLDSAIWYGLLTLGIIIGILVGMRYFSVKPVEPEIAAC